MPVELDSPTLGVGTDWNSFYATEPLQPNDPYSPSSFGMLLFSEPDADSALALLGGVKSPLRWGQIQGDISDQLDLAAALGTGIIPDGVKLYDNAHVLALDTGTRLLSGNWTTTQISSPNGSTYLNNSGFFGDGTNLFYSDQIQSRTSLGLVSDIDLIGGNVLTIGAIQHDSFDTDRAFTFNGTTTNGDLPTILYAYVTSPVTLTFPSSYRIGAASNPATSLDLPLGYHELKWISVGGIYWLVDDLDAGGGSANWGSITGTITDQTDLVTYVAAHGGSFLSNNTARVDPSGNDSTGTIGDLGKPFLTAQAVLTRAETLSISDLAIDIGNNSTGETLTTSLQFVAFSGLGGGFVQLFSSLTLTGSGAAVSLSNAYVGDITATNASSLLVIGFSSEIGNITNSHAGGTLDVQGDAGLNGLGNLTANGTIHVYGSTYLGTVSAPGHDIHIINGSSVFEDDGPTIDSAGSEVWVTNTKVKQVTAAATLHLIDSRVIGTNNATSTVYADVLLLPRYQMSIDFNATAGLKLLNDSSTPGNSKYYGTDSGGTKGYFSLPAGTVTSIGLSTDRSWLTVGSSPVTTSGTITLNGTTGLTANQVLATPNGSSGAVSLRALVAADIPVIPESGVTNLVSDLALKAPLASPGLTGTPTAPTQSQGNNSTAISTTAYTDLAVANAVAGVNPAVAVAAATTAASDTSGFTYNNGVGGIGATLTGPTNNTAITFDGFTFTALGQRALVKNDTQSPSGAFNGVYYVTQLQGVALKPILTRALDYNQSSDINNTGAIPVVNGTANIDTSWLLTSSVTTVGTDPLTYVQFSINPTTIVTTSRTLTIAGTPFDLSANRSWTLDTISGVSANGFLKRTGANTWTNDSSTYLTANQTVTLSGDVTGSGATAITATLANIPTAVPMAGYLGATAIVAPGTPASGIGRIYIDSTSKNLSVKDDAGTVKHGVQTKAAVTSNFLTAISDAGVVSAAQPASTDLSDTNYKITSCGIAIDGQGAAISTGLKGYITVPYAGTITAWSIVADGASPTCTFDVWKIATGTALPTVTNTIMGTKPALSTGNAVRSTTRTSWTTSVAANDIIGFNVDAVTVATKIAFQLEITKT